MKEYQEEHEEYIEVSTVTLKKGKEQSVYRKHPWVFSGAIKKIKGNPEEGEIVVVYSNDGDFLGIGHYQIGSIMVRIFEFDEIEPTYEYWKDKFERTIAMRTSLGFFDNEQTNVFRLIHGEGDGFPGFVADYYNGTVVFQMHSIGMWLIREELAEILKELLGDRLKAVYDKSAKTLPFKADIDPVDGYIMGEGEPVVVKEYNNKYHVDWVTGQKTGFFIDQRENRKLLQDYAKDREVLNMFCYSGGFSFFAMSGGAKLVHSVDASEKAIELTNANVSLNFGDDPRHQAYVSDAFDFMKNIKDKYDLIVLDPPAFAKHRNSLGQALQAYKRINAMALKQIRSGGILFTFSCSQVVSKENFKSAIFGAAAQAGRNVRILHYLNQPVDHPTNIYHPEGDYLKGLVLYVE